jgi:hypothetical protein
VTAQSQSASDNTQTQTDLNFPTFTTATVHPYFNQSIEHLNPQMPDPSTGIILLKTKLTKQTTEYDSLNF